MKEKNERRLNLQQEKFCQLYATNREFFGNGTQTYIEVYNPEKIGNWYKSAMASSARLLRDVRIIRRINELLESGGMNNEFIDKQLLFLITQHADFSSKIRAIQEYNKLRRRIAEKIEHSGEMNLYSDIPDELKKEIQEFKTWQKNKR